MNWLAQTCGVVASGCWYWANVSLKTPLEALRRHGEHFPGTASNAPVIAGGNHGAWLGRAKTWREMGINVPELVSTTASPIGPVAPAEVIPFLIAFREIVESDLNQKTKIAQLRELRKHPLHGPYWKRFAKAYQDFPHSFFYLPLTQLPGVGQKTAKALYEAGFHTPSAIGAASLEELSLVPGLGKATASKLQRACQA
jgi:hypothetical protein